MELYTHPSAPAISREVRRRMHAFDWRLAVTWSPVSIDLQTSYPINFRGQDGVWIPEPVPVYHVWCKEEATGRYHYIRSHPRFGHREIDGLEADAARHMSPGELVHEQRKVVAMREERAKKAWVERNADKRAANKSRITDLLVDGKSGQRDAKISSYAGQTNRGTRGTVMTDARDDGWELPEEE